MPPSTPGNTTPVPTVPTPPQPNIPTNQQIPLGSPLLAQDWPGPATGGFGFRFNGTDYHHGIDIAVGKKYYGIPVFTPAGGTVKWISSGKSCGHGLGIQHADGFSTTYCHLKEPPLVSKGQTVTAGRKIDSNPSMGIDMSHLHYEISYKGSANSITAPNGQTIPIKRGQYSTVATKGCKNCINPVDFVNYPKN